MPHRRLALCSACQVVYAAGWTSPQLSERALSVCRIHRTLNETQPTEPLVYLSRLAQEVPLPQLPASRGTLPVLVLGGEDDAFLDPEGCRETADWVHADQLVMVPGIAHDMMLVSPACAPCLPVSLCSVPIDQLLQQRILKVHGSAARHAR